MKTRPLYQMIFEELEENILNSTYKAGDSLPTEADIMKRYSVSSITAKRAMSELVNRGLAYRVKGKGSFVIEPAGRGAPPVDPSVRNIALVVPHKVNFGRLFEICEGLEEALSDESSLVSIYYTHEDWQQEKRTVEMLMQAGISGMVLIPVSNLKNIDLIYRLKMMNFPLVVLDKTFEGIEVNYVLNDNMGGCELSAKHLIDTGFRNLFYVADSYISESSTVRERYFGFYKVCFENKLPTGPDVLHVIQHLDNESILDKSAVEKFSDITELQELKELVKQLLAYGKVGIMTAHDYLGLYVCKLAMEMGASIPEEISVIGFDNLAATTFQDLPLSSVDYDFHRIGRCAGELVKASRATPGSYQRLVVPSRLVLGKTTIRQSE